MICLDSCRHFVFRHMLCILFVCLVQVSLLIMLLHHWDVLCLLVTACVLGCCEGSALQVHLLSRAAKRGRDIVIGVCVLVCVRVCVLVCLSVCTN